MYFQMFFRYINYFIFGIRYSWEIIRSRYASASQFYYNWEIVWWNTDSTNVFCCSQTCQVGLIFCLKRVLKMNLCRFFCPVPFKYGQKLDWNIFSLVSLEIDIELCVAESVKIFCATPKSALYRQHMPPYVSKSRTKSSSFTNYCLETDTALVLSQLEKRSKFFWNERFSFSGNGSDNFGRVKKRTLSENLRRRINSHLWIRQEFVEKKFHFESFLHRYSATGRVI